MEDRTFIKLGKRLIELIDFEWNEEKQRMEYETKGGHFGECKADEIISIPCYLEPKDYFSFAIADEY